MKDVEMGEGGGDASEPLVSKSLLRPDLTFDERATSALVSFGESCIILVSHIEQSRGSMSIPRFSMCA